MIAHAPSQAAGQPWRALQDAAAPAAVLATFAATLALFLLSPITLESFGFPYLSSGGGIFSKLHPATFIAIGAIGLRCAATRRPAQTAWRLATGDAGIVLLIGATAVATVIAIGVAKTPFTPLIDTFILPPLMFLLLRGLDPRLTHWLALLIGVLLFANAIIALIEFLKGGWRFIHIEVPDGVSADPTRSDVVFSWQAQFVGEWRATAILGHPLANGLIVGEFLLCLAAIGSRWIPTAISVPLGGLELASMFAFGARTSLVLSIAFGGILLFLRALDGLARGARLDPRVIALALVGSVVILIGIDILNEYNFFDRMIDRFTNDAGSATARVTMFELFNNISWSDLMLGPDQDLIATSQRLYGLEFGIESSWIGLILNYGLIVAILLVVGLLAFSRSIIRETGRGAIAILIFYFILASSAQTLSTKTTSLAMTVCLLFLYLPRGNDRVARAEARKAERVGTWP